MVARVIDLRLGGVRKKKKYEVLVPVGDGLRVVGKYRTKEEAQAVYDDHMLFRTDRRSLPVTREECKHGVRPCPYVTCRHHLWTDSESRELGSLVREPEETGSPSCALDVADAGEEMDLEAIAEVMRISSSSVHNSLNSALTTLRDKLRDYSK